MHPNIKKPRPLRRRVGDGPAYEIDRLDAAKRLARHCTGWDWSRIETAWRDKYLRMVDVVIQYRGAKTTVEDIT